ncbi:bifunctional adenosylcobinamide kinase/adenosylcobinamide-phosphate guanylyltransferase [Rhizobium sp. SAFR-030]|uniref:bifunctional adenosylcobinamide kinase/adenosylcobinamide-phosphate guanylyltransferase n=1 Tax=Rhizobium sp. SAFR-030 TaxID=3387277 RepID=UPI003F7F17CF
MDVPQSGKIILVLGGARSGKSVFSESLAISSCLERHYIATSQPFDDEMQTRIAQHKEQRGDGWMTHEVPVDLPEAIGDVDAGDRVILVDCLTLWLSNLMMAARDVQGEGEQLAGALRKIRGQVILVSNEVGLGIVPDNKMARQFRDHAGRLHQQIASIADEVYFVAAGLPLRMKG